MGFNYNYYYYVNGIDEARNFQMQPNQVALLMDNYKPSPIVFRKATNIKMLRLVFPIQKFV